MSSLGGLRRLQRSAAPLFLASIVAGAAYPVRSQEQPRVRIAWQDVAVFHDALQARGIDRSNFDSHVERLQRTNIERVREGDLDHLVFYLLQSTRFTNLSPIEPAQSAKALVDGLSAEAREAFLAGGSLPATQLPPAVHARAAALLRALDGGGAEDDSRLAYFRELVSVALPEGEARQTALVAEYLRAMRFLYRQEFVAQRGANPSAAVRDLYQRRGFSTDTAVEAGFLVHSGLGVAKGLEPDRRVRRVLIVGPGMDLAPRTAFVEGPAESYQPWAVIDALLALGLAGKDTLEVVAADINPRVVAHLERARLTPPRLSLVTELAERDGVTLSEDYREYFAQLGRAIGDARPAGRQDSSSDGRLRKTVVIRAAVARTLRVARLDVVTERLEGPPFDLVIATNVLPYFDDPGLMLAVTNIAAMLAPGGVFLHNEPRPVLGEITDALGLPFEQSRHAVIARVVGAPPLGDSIWLHRKRAP